MIFAFIFEELRQEFLKPEPNFKSIIIWLVKSKTKLEQGFLILPFILHEMYCTKTKVFFDENKQVESLSFYFSDYLDKLFKKDPEDLTIVLALALKYLATDNTIQGIECLKRVVCSNNPYRSLAEQYLSKVVCEDRRL